MASRTQGDKEGRRNNILHAARQVFARKGYEPATLEAVAREAGLAKGTLYLYFKNKEDLYFHTVLSMLEGLQASIQAQAERSGDALDKLRGVAAGQFDFFLRHRDTLQLFASFSNPSLVRLHKRLIAPVMEKWAGYAQRVTALVEEGQRTGALRRDVAPRDIALAFIGMTNLAAQTLVSFGPIARHGVPASVKPGAVAAAKRDVSAVAEHVVLAGAQRGVLAGAQRGVLASGPGEEEPQEAPERMADTILQILLEGVRNR